MIFDATHSIALACLIAGSRSKVSVKIGPDGIAKIGRSVLGRKDHMYDQQRERLWHEVSIEDAHEENMQAILPWGFTPGRYIPGLQPFVSAVFINLGRCPRLVYCAPLALDQMIDRLSDRSFSR